jgi:EmrB/QacA subfamily drug resistance transporter
MHDHELDDATLSSRHIHLVMIALMTGVYLAALSSSVLTTAQPNIVGEFGSQENLAWIFTGYLLTQTIATPILGKLSDIYGRKVVFQASIVLFVVFSVAAGFSQNMGQLVVLRALQGIGAGGLIALPMAISADIVPPKDRGRYQGYMSITFSLASISGPFVGGVFADHLSWRWAFYVNVPIGLASMAATQRLLHIPMRPTRRPVDYIGAALMLGGLSPVLLALSIGGKNIEWGSSEFAALMTVGIALLIAFVWWETRAEEPLLPLRIFTNDIVRTCGVASLIVGLSMFGTSVLMSSFLQIVLGLSATQSGFLLISMFAGVTVGSVSTGRIVTRTERYKIVMIVGMAILTVGVASITLLSSHSTRWHVSGCVFLVGLGQGAVMPVMVLVAQNASEYRDIGVTTSTMNFLRSIGSSVGSAVYGAVYAARLRSELRSNLSVDELASINVRGTPAQIRSIDNPETLSSVLDSFADAITACFVLSIPVCVVTLVVLLFLREIPLRRTIRERPEPAPQVAVPAPSR